MRSASFRPASETHWITVDGDAFRRLESIARLRRVSVARLLDDAINRILDREAA